VIKNIKNVHHKQQLTKNYMLVLNKKNYENQLQQINIIDKKTLCFQMKI